MNGCVCAERWSRSPRGWKQVSQHQTAARFLLVKRRRKRRWRHFRGGDERRACLPNTLATPPATAVTPFLVDTEAWEQLVGIPRTFETNEFDLEFGGRRSKVTVTVTKRVMDHS